LQRPSSNAITSLLLAGLLSATVLTAAGPVEAPTKPPAAAPVAGSGPYRAASPEYGLSVFAFGHPDTSDRDLDKISALKFGWQKSTFQWRAIEGDCKGCFDWNEADRVVKASNARGLKIIGRLDFQPDWARADHAYNGPPDNYQDYADFVNAFVSRYSATSSIGTVSAIEVWNEVNLAREWGEAQITPSSAADYVRLLRMANDAAKAADPTVTVIAAGLSPTGYSGDSAQPDTTYFQWMYDAGALGAFDVMAANANVQCPSVEAFVGGCAWPTHAPGTDDPSFYFRRVEQIHDIMVGNGDVDKQIWLMEFGWTTEKRNPDYSWYATDEKTKGDLIVGAFKFARGNWSPWIGVMTLWTIADPWWDTAKEQTSWAITNPDGSNRPAYTRVLQARKSGELE
jgi:hypothetical protein